jgi:hypothetical protein
MKMTVSGVAAGADWAPGADGSTRTGAVGAEDSEPPGRLQAASRTAARIRRANTGFMIRSLAVGNKDGESIIHALRDVGFAIS